MAYSAPELIDFATAILTRAGLSTDRAGVVADLLVEGDLMGHDTHGLAQLPSYVTELKKGTMKNSGEPEIVSNTGTVQVWDGNYLPGLWLTAKALDAASAVARDTGIGVVSVRRSHHIGCLQAYLPSIVERGQMAILCCSDPHAASVAPHNGMDRVLTPNPIACGIPTKGDPILIDISASITTNGMVARLADEGKRLPGVWGRDGDGNPTSDPREVHGSANGTLLPVGGIDHGHKGYALALMVEALTQALSGYGRAEKPKIWGASVLVQVYDPRCFAGYDSFVRQTTFVANASRSSRAAPGCSPVRLPGQSGMERKREALANGLVLRADLIARLQALAQGLELTFPRGSLGRLEASA